ncbi:protein kinase domain-containing protein [Aquimarina sp. M1]
MHNFTFPENKCLHKGVIKNYSISNGKFDFSSIDISKPSDNLITIDKIDYCFTYINSTGRNKGGNSVILFLYESQKIDRDDLSYEEPDLVLKILKFKKATNPRFARKSEIRFNKEVEALRACKNNKYQNVVVIEQHGTCKIFNPFNNSYQDYLFYTMEYAESDLKAFLENNIELSLNERIALCLSLSKGLKELNSMGYFHRDIKPDNIFITDKTWKIADLGLLDERDESLDIDDPNEFIGPRGWHSPEAMNKYLCEGKDFKENHDCIIDHQSDIFQLGKVFWYIIQNNAPTGIFKQQDAYIKNNDVYVIIRTMLNYSKKRRYKNIDEVINLLKPIERKLQLAI